MKAKRTFSRRGLVFREGETIPAGVIPEKVMPLLIAEGWVEDEAPVPVVMSQGAQTAEAEIKIVKAKPARKKSKK